MVAHPPARGKAGAGIPGRAKREPGISRFPGAQLRT